MENKEKDVQLGVRVHGTIALKEVRYQILPLGNGKEKMEVKDEIIHSEITHKGFKLFYSRSVKLSPSAFFELFVSYESIVEFDDAAGEKILKDDARIREWIENNEVRIANSFNLPAKASHLIADVSEGAGFAPILTNPTVILPGTDF